MDRRDTARELYIDIKDLDRVQRNIEKAREALSFARGELKRVKESIALIQSEVAIAEK